MTLVPYIVIVVIFLIVAVNLIIPGIRPWRGWRVGDTRA